MAKKTVATLRDGQQDGRAYTKVIKMVNLFNLEKQYKNYVKKLIKK